MAVPAPFGVQQYFPCAYRDCVNYGGIACGHLPDVGRVIQDDALAYRELHLFHSLGQRASGGERHKDRIRLILNAWLIEKELLSRFMEFIRLVCFLRHNLNRALVPRITTISGGGAGTAEGAGAAAIATGFGRGATGRGFATTGSTGLDNRVRPAYREPTSLPGVFSIA